MNSAKRLDGITVIDMGKPLKVGLFGCMHPFNIISVVCCLIPAFFALS
jgi:hypothetical protein